MKSRILFIIVILQLFACKSERSMSFSDFVEVKKIEKVIMNNNSGEFTLSAKQLAKYKEEIPSMTYISNTSIKTGTIHMTLFIDNKKYYIATRTNGDLVEVDYKLITKKKLVFKTNGINFDNYKKKELIKNVSKHCENKNTNKVMFNHGFLFCYNNIM